MYFTATFFFLKLRGIGYRRWEGGKIVKVETWRTGRRYSNWYKVQKSTKEQIHSKQNQSEYDRIPYTTKYNLVQGPKQQTLTVNKVLLQGSHGLFTYLLFMAVLLQQLIWKVLTATREPAKPKICTTGLFREKACQHLPYHLTVF